MRLLFTFVLVAGLAVMPFTPANANLILNGSFEEGSLAGIPFVNVPPGSTAITGWTVTGQVDWYDSYPLWFASDGSRSVDLEGSAPDGSFAGGIQQTFATTPGQQYEVTFDMAGNTDGGPTIKTLRVSAAGQYQDFTFDITVQPSFLWDWETYHWIFRARSFSTTLEFQDATDPALGYGPTLDNVSVDSVERAPVPEPSTLLLLGSGLAGLGGFAWRRHRK